MRNRALLVAVSVVAALCITLSPDVQIEICHAMHCSRAVRQRA